MQRPNNEYYKSFNFYCYLKTNLQNERSIENIESVIEKHTYVYQPPYDEGFIYEIVSGAVKLGSYSEQGEEFVYDILHKGDFFGNLRYLNMQFFEFSKTLIDTKIRKYEISFFKKTISNDPYLSDWFLSYLTKRWCISEMKMGNITGNKIEDRISFVRKFFNIEVHDARGEQFLLFNLLTQKDVGDLSGATRQTISTILKKKSI
ncbi:Crp/Fnr family transcriptional regulator [Flavobacterium sp. W20_MBD1_R3]|uniref:Crp/Fnr family transcriptional regulator n=1 Tax=Flavobacterium sp. W20_MBD1_R3 TaxID=3240278 RepID=UPI003F8E149E